MHKSPQGLSENVISFPKMKYSLSVFLPRYQVKFKTFRRLKWPMHTPEAEGNQPVKVLIHPGHNPSYEM
jgi:hypothetical protein